MVRDGRLRFIGSGQARKITIESIESFCERFCDKPTTQPLSVSWVSAHHEIKMKRKIQRLPALSTAEQTARLLGLPLAQVELGIKNRGIPAVKIGDRRYVKAAWIGRVLCEAYTLAGQEAAALAA